MKPSSSVPLGEQAEVIRGVTFSKKDASSAPSEGLVPVLRAGNIQSSLETGRDLVFVPEAMVAERQYLLPDDIVMCTSSGSADVVGKTAFCFDKWKGSFGAFCAVLRARSEKAEPRFLHHFLQSPHFRHWARNSAGINIKNIRKTELEALPVPAPPLDEQRRIAAILDKADAIRRKREQALALADDLLKSTFLEMFGDPVKNPFKFEFLLVSGCLSTAKAGTQSGPFGAALKKHEYTRAGVPVWGVENVQQNHFIDKPKLFISEEKFASLQRYAVEQGDVLISRAGTVGRMCIATPSVAQSIISTNLVRVALDHSKILPEYFVSLFTYVPHRLGALKANNKRDAFTFLNPKTLRATEIPVPPIELQQRYRDFLVEVDKLISKQTCSLSNAEKLLSSLSQRAFRGEL